MRTAFIEQLIVEARTNSRIFLAVGDLGFSVVEPFASEFPDRFLNAGVAEQNMTGLAAGLAAEGYHVFTYSIANFPTLRCIEQIRNDVVYHGLSVTVVSVGAGFSYGNLGYSHHAVQDVGMMRCLGNIAVISPADPGEMQQSVRWIASNPQPSYLRVGKAGEPALHDRTGPFGSPVEIVEGRSRTAVVAYGSILQIVLGAVRQFNHAGRDDESVSAFSMPLLNPVSGESLSCLNRFDRVIAVEEHLAAGGLGSILRENLPHRIKVDSMASPLAVLGQVGSQSRLRELAGLTVGRLLENLGRK